MIVEIEPVVATMEDRILSYFWVRGGDHAEFEAAFQDDSSVAQQPLSNRFRAAYNNLITSTLTIGNPGEDKD